MIIGTGSDILATSEVKKSFKKMGWTFVHQVLGSLEISVFSEINDFDEEVMYLARRLVAKEAIIKALRESSRDLRKFQILNDATGRMYVAYSTDLSDSIKFHLTISDCGDYVMAVVVCERT